jgi:hypothetical protein
MFYLELILQYQFMVLETFLFCEEASNESTSTIERKCGWSKAELARKAGI